MRAVSITVWTNSAGSAYNPYLALLEESKDPDLRRPTARRPDAQPENHPALLSIGQDLSFRFAAEGWGTKVVDRLTKAIGRNFPAGRASASGIFATCASCVAGCLLETALDFQTAGAHPCCGFSMDKSVATVITR